MEFEGGLKFNEDVFAMFPRTVPVAIPQDRRPRPQSSRRGFTLVEMLGVAAIMVLITSFSVTLFRSGSSINKQAWELAGFIEHARAYAVANNTYVWVGVNEKKASTDTKINTAVFTFALQDGTSTLVLTNVQRVAGPKIFENFRITNLTAQQFGGRPTVADGVSSFVPGRASSLRGLMPFKLTDYIEDSRVLRINPEGSVEVPANAGLTLMSLPKYLEMGLQPMKGTVADRDQKAAIQIAGLNGRIRVYKP